MKAVTILFNKYGPTTASARTDNSAALHSGPVMQSVKTPGNLKGGSENETLRGVVATHSYEGRYA
jgi:hypothetical protein